MKILEKIVEFFIIGLFLVGILVAIIAFPTTIYQVFIKENTSEIYLKLLNNEKVILNNLDNFQLKQIISISQNSEKNYHLRYESYKKNLQQYNLIKVLYSTKQKKLGSILLKNCETEDIIPNEKASINCDNILHIQAIDYIRKSCSVLYFDDEDISLDEIENLGGDIICQPSTSFGKAFSQSCEPLGTSIFCSGKPTPLKPISNFILGDSTVRKIKNIIYLRLSRKFKGRCKRDCSGHVAGYNWAKKNKIVKIELCSGNSKSFIDGCRMYINQ